VSASFVTRFAPSPTGYLHRGHAFSALTAFEAARAVNGRFILRIEDIDATRCRPDYVTALLEDLAWLGISWEKPVRRQSAHLADYEAAIESLRARNLVYRCFRTRKDIAEAAVSAPHGPVEAFRGGPLHPNEEDRFLSEGRPFAWRLSLDEARKLAPYQNATGLQVTSAVLAGMVWAVENPNAGIVEADEMDYRRCLEVQSPYLGPVKGHYTDWNPLQDRERLFPEELSAPKSIRREAQCPSFVIFISTRSTASLTERISSPMRSSKQRN
jgi:hypothetical protein